MKKQCKKCGHILDLECFNKGIRMKDGHINTCKKCVKSYHKKRYSEKKHDLIEYSRKYRKEKIKKDPEYYKIRQQEWRERNNGGYNERTKEYYRNYYKDKRENDEIFNIANRMRNTIWSVIKGIRCSNKTLNILGVKTRHEFLNYIESKFKKNMNWKNYGRNGWTIDHIIPVCNFDLNDEKQFLECFHHTNLQPMNFRENCRKGSKIRL